MRKMHRPPLNFDDVVIDWRTVGLFQTNSFLVICAKTKEAVLVDSCGEFEVLKAMIESHEGVKLRYLLQTHAHLDHVAALAEMREWTQAPIVLHPEEMPLYEAVPMQCRLFGLPQIPSPPAPDQWVQEGDEISFGELTAKVVFTPGHTPGGITFEIGNHLFVGDTLFQGSIGRTDLPGGDYPTLMESLQRLLVYSDDALVFSGHGPVTTIGREREFNPFLS
ncbi:MAG: MBL fold metallo-hydrolase [Myxococcales bacterium]|nr:MBL fold metallo-hydrolase [Myxococcales bacterium]MCB9644226.1 MBL fold metallo-hydrolase [Myxococcales bacterium]